MSTFWIVIITAMPSLAAGFLVGMQFGKAVQFSEDFATVMEPAKKNERN